MSNKTTKPTRQELLSELESIRDSLLEECVDMPVPDEPNNKDSSLAITQERPAITEEDLVSESLDYSLDIPDNDETVEPSTTTPNTASNAINKENQDSSMIVLPGQQSLFEDSSETTHEQPTTKQRDAIQNAPIAEQAIKPEETEPNADEQSTENPFLPKHVKERLQKERSLYQKEIDAAVKMPGLNPYEAPEEEQESLINEIVASYLPQIEQELRRRLKERLDSSESEEE